MLLILIITTYKEKPRKPDACWLLIFCENQIGELYFTLPEVAFFQESGNVV